MSGRYEHARISLGGVELEGWSDASFVVERSVAVRESLAHGRTSGTVTITFEDGGVALQRALFRLTPNQRGTPIAKMWRRAWYGGRNGRSAWRRLAALARAGVEVGFYTSVAASERAS